MKDKELNEKESLELIARMIRNTRRNLDTGSGNSFFECGICRCVGDFGRMGRCHVYG